MCSLDRKQSPHGPVGLVGVTWSAQEGLCPRGGWAVLLLMSPQLLDSVSCPEQAKGPDPISSCLVCRAWQGSATSGTLRLVAEGC